MQQDRKARAGRDPALGGRPLPARSVIASILLGTSPPELPVRVLVRTCELFGIVEGTTRVAISRMQAAGELDGDGGRYRLAGRLLDRRARQEQSRHPQLAPWSGDWRVAVVTGERRRPVDRAALRDAMRDLRLAEWREGVWARPDNLPAAAAASGEADAVAAGQCRWLTARPDGDGPALAAALWDLAGWADRAGDLSRAMADSLPRLQGGDTGALAPAFVLAATVLRHQQADPLLPDALLPPGWPGADLRTQYEDYESAFRRLLRTWTSG